ncbi:TIGR04219 family outer membrane beta-barrel protein [Hydrogenimonas sp.]
MKSLSAAASALLFCAAVTASADTIGGEISAGGWNHDPSGWVEYPTGSDKVDLDKDLNLDTRTELFLRAKIEHPVPLLPNIRLGFTKNRSSGDGTISRTFNFGGASFAASEKVHTETKLDTYDATFYYEIVDTGIDLDLGLTARYIDGFVDLKSLTTGRAEKTEFTGVFPMLYANARVPLPLTGLSIGAEGSYVTYDGSTLYDLQADVRYTFAMGLGIEAGYRAQKIKLDDVENTSTDIDIEGLFIGAVWDF